MTDARHVTDLLPAVVNGSADESERATFDSHVASCAACAGELEEWRQIAMAVRADAPEAPQAAAVMDGVWPELDAATAAERATPSWGRSSWGRAWRPVWSTAAVLVFVFALVVVERGQQTPQEVLLAAAVRTTAQETARLRVTGSTRVEFDSADGLPADAEGTSVANLDAHISGRGAVRFGEALHVWLRLGLDASAVGVQERNEIVERLVLQGKRFERRDEGDWFTLDDATGMVGLAVLGPRLPERVLSNAAEAVHVLHALRIQGTGPASTPVAGRWDIDMRVDLIGLRWAGGHPVATEPGRPVTRPTPDLKAPSPHHQFLASKRQLGRRPCFTGTTSWAAGLGRFETGSPLARCRRTHCHVPRNYRPRRHACQC